MGRRGPSRCGAGIGVAVVSFHEKLVDVPERAGGGTGPENELMQELDLVAGARPRHGPGITACDLATAPHVAVGGLPRHLGTFHDTAVKVVAENFELVENNQAKRSSCSSLRRSRLVIVRRPGASAGRTVSRNSMATSRA